MLNVISPALWFDKSVPTMETEPQIYTSTPDVQESLFLTLSSTCTRPFRDAEAKRGRTEE
jgi:hypothetical protein